MIRRLVSYGEVLTYEWIARYFDGSENCVVDEAAATTNAVAKAIELRRDIAILEISATDRLELINCMKSA